MVATARAGFTGWFLVLLLLGIAGFEFVAVTLYRINQKMRTQVAVVDAARTLIGGSGEITMLAVAQEALVSEATAYRYFRDLPSLLREALAGAWASPASHRLVRSLCERRDRQCSPNCAHPY